MRRLLLLLGLVALLVGGCGDGGRGDDQLTDAKVNWRCPSQQLEGKPATFTVQVENTGDEDWPAVFVEWKGLRSIFDD